MQNRRKRDIFAFTKTKFMKPKKLKYLFLPLCLAALTTACTQKEKGFTVSGQIADADDKMLYFEALSLNGIQKLDSTKLDDDGDFSFHGARPENPEFFRIRLGEQIINLAVDSTEEIRIKANAADMGANYSVEGSENCVTLQKNRTKTDECGKKYPADCRN